MGRFYKTAKPELLDFMYQVPEQAILGAIKGADTQIDNEIKYYTDLQKQLKHQALPPDAQKQKDLLAKYEDEIKQRSYQISTNPLDALKEKQKIRELGETIYKDVTRGELAAQYSNFNARQEYEKRYKEEMMKTNGRIIPKQLEDAMAAWDATYAAKKYDKEGNLVQEGGVNYDPVTGNYRRYSAPELASFMNLEETTDTGAKDWKADSVKNNYAYVGGDGKWKIKGATGEREAKFSDIFDNVLKNTYHNQKQMDFLNQQILVNKMAGGNPGVGLTEEQVYGKKEVVGQDANGKDIVDFVYRTYVDDKGKTQYQTDKYGNKIPVYGGMIYDAVYKAAEKHGFKETEKGNTDISETEQYKSDIAAAQKEKEKAAEIVSFTNNQAEAKVQLLKGNTVGEVKDNLGKRETALDNELLLAAKSYGDDIYNNITGVDPKVKGEISFEVGKLMTQIQKEKDPDKASQLFDRLQNYITGLNKTYKNISGIENIGTGVKELKNKIVTERNNIYNDKQLLGSIWNEAADQLGLTSDIKSLRFNLDNEKFRLKQINIKTSTDRDTYERDLAAQTAKVNAIEKQLKEKELEVSNKANLLMPEKNYSTVTISSTGGDYFKTIPGITDNMRLNYDKAIKEAAKQPLMANLLSGSKAQFLMKGKSQPLTYQKAMEEGLFDDVEEDEDGNVRYIKDNKVVASFKKQVQSMRNVLTDLPQLGVSTKDYQVTLLATDKKSSDYMGFSTGELYIPFDEMSNQEIKTIFNQAGPALTAQNLKQKANTNNVNKNDKNYHYRETHDGQTFMYYPNVRNDQGQGKWLIPTEEGIQTVYGDAGQMMMINQLKK